MSAPCWWRLRTLIRPARCSARSGAQHWSNGRRRATDWSSRTTTTPSFVTTARRSVRFKVWRRSGWPTRAASARRSTPALRLGWMALPRWLIGDVMREKYVRDMGTSMLEQVASSAVHRCRCARSSSPLVRVRPIYRRRRDTVLESLASGAARCATERNRRRPARVRRELPVWCDESSLDRGRATRRGFSSEEAAGAWSDPSPPPALVLGYGAINEQAIRDGVAVLGSIYERLAGDP